MIAAWICSKVQSAGVCSVYIRKTLIVLTVVCLALFGAISLLPQITFKSELLHTTPSTSHFYETVAHFLEEPLPQPQVEISEVSPLFFFHQRKAGGSSFREFLATAGTEHNLTTFLPCYNGISWDTYTIGSHLASIYGGHFRWGEQKELDRHRKFGARANATRKFNCITNFRSPTARLTSCYYYRFIQEELLNRETYGCIGDISPLEFENVLLHGRTRYGRSCLNEPWRIMSGILDEDIINSALNTSSLNAKVLVELTLDNIAQCVPYVLEEPNSTAVIAHWFPQLASSARSFFADPKIFNRGEAMPRNCTLSAEHFGVIKRLTMLEELVYDAVFDKFKAFELAVVSGAPV